MDSPTINVAGKKWVEDPDSGTLIIIQLSMFLKKLWHFHDPVKSYAELLEPGSKIL